MKKLLALLLLMALVVFPGCNSSTGNDNDNGGNNGGTTGAASTYLPFKVGNSWTFTSTDESGTSTYTDTVGGTASISGNTYWFMNETNTTSEPDTTYFRVAGNNLYTFLDVSVYNFMGGVARSAKSVAAIKAAIADMGPEVIMAKFGVSAGTTWAMYDLTLPTSEKTSIKGKYVGLENVQTTAGNFTNCAKFEMDVSYSASYEGVAISMTAAAFQWFAPGVGPVKFSTTAESNYAGQKFTFTTSDILKSYTVQ